MPYLIPITCLIVLAFASMTHAGDQKTQIWEDGTKYVGEVIEGKRHGKGTILWPDGTRYIGTFRNNMRHGPGTMILPDGTIYNGTFEDDQLLPPSPGEDNLELLTRESQPSVLTPVTELTAEIEQQLIATLELWSTSWSEKNAPQYLATYHEMFKVPTRLTRRQWEILRRSRIKRPRNISVTLEFGYFELIETNTASVEVQQTYKSEVYSDKTTKRFTLLRNDNGDWKIFEETVVKSNR
jgi:hypothetical protein